MSKPRISGDIEGVPRGAPEPPHALRDRAIAEAAYAIRDLANTANKILGKRLDEDRRA
jgi:hypothetical protein